MSQENFNSQEKKMKSEQLSAWIARSKKCVTFTDKRKEIPRKAKYKKNLLEFENSPDF